MKFQAAKPNGVVWSPCRCVLLAAGAGSKDIEQGLLSTAEWMSETGMRPWLMFSLETCVCASIPLSLARKGAAGLSSNRSGRASSGHLHQAVLVSCRSAAWGSSAMRLTSNSRRSALARCLSARSCRPSLQDLCRASSPGEKGCTPGRAEPPRQPDQLAGVRGPLPSCSLVASGLKEEVEKGKVKKCLSRHPCKQCREGQPNPELPCNIIYHPHPSEAQSPTVLVLQDVVSTTRRMCYLGGATRSSGPQHVCAVPGEMPACRASLTLTMDTAQHSQSPARHRARSPAHPRVQPPPWGGASPCCIGPFSPPHTPARVREAHTKTSGWDRPVSSFCRGSMQQGYQH